MKKFRRYSGFVFGIMLALAGCVPAHAQVVSNPTGSMITTNGRYTTYSASFTAITTAASLTDFLTLTGSATKTIYLRQVECSGTSSAAATSTLSLVKRSTADTGGTAITPSATAGGQLVAHDAGNSAATATVVAYSANPTVGTLAGIMRVGKLSTNVAAGSPSPLLTWTFGQENAQTPTLHGTTQVLALGGLGTALAAGSVLSCDITWIEGL